MAEKYIFAKTESMTIREHLEQLRDDFAQKTDDYLKAEKRLVDEGNGFFDPKLLDDLAEAKAAWQQANNAYNILISQIVNHRLNVDAEMA